MCPTHLLREGGLMLLQLCQLLHESGHRSLCSLHTLWLCCVGSNDPQNALNAPNPAFPRVFLLPLPMSKDLYRLIALSDDPESIHKAIQLYT